MDEKEVKETILNRAKVEAAQELTSNDCLDDVIFLMKDNYHTFSVGLNTILECLEAAILHGDLPKLPQGWCFSVRDAFGASFDEDAYYDDRVYEREWK